jgi:UDP-N-acetylglucosamine 2-epimerase (non-hydrolysing)
VNRKLTGSLTQFHFAPTDMSRNNLLAENVPEDNILITGNTVIDALLDVATRVSTAGPTRDNLDLKFDFVTPGRRMILVTGHRRESFGDGFERICNALATIAHDYPDLDIVYPVHLNPAVQRPVNQILKGVPNIHLIEPVGYLDFVYLMTRAYIIITDSGGVQEEAPSLGKPVLVMRETTERPEAVAAGTVRLVGTDVGQIVGWTEKLLNNQAIYDQMSQAHNPYGDGQAAKRICERLATLKTLN